MSKEHTLCWTCANAGGNCEWSKDFDPVPGWVAKRVPTLERCWKVKGNGKNYGYGRNPSLDKPSYIIYACPRYEKG